MGGLTLEGMVEKMYTDLYVGNGVNNPSITTRLASIEEVIRTFKHLFWIGVATLLTLIADIIVHLVK